MAKKNDLSRLISQAGKSRPSSPPFAGGPRSPSRSNDVRAQSIASVDTHHSGITFGSPSHNSTATTNSGTSAWSHLLRQTVSKGLSSALGGGAGSFAAIGGLGGIISGLVGLFGSHKKTPPPLTLFRLPDAQNETVYTSSHTANVVPQSGIYTSQHTDSAQYHSAQIAQAVKHALLNSSSLNDVISEI